MSVQVSYKKQSVLWISGLLIIFLVVELIANVWWITQLNCEFENNEIFEQMSDDKKHQLCVDLYEVKTIGTELIPNQKSQSISINSVGFRGEELSSETLENGYRIFMLGGSTMFGHGATSDQTTIPGYLEKIFLTSEEKYPIEIINAGVQGADSFTELNLLKTKITNLSPNMVIVYDGWNDLRAQHSVETISKNWESICKIGLQNNFDVVIMLQPIAGFGNKPLTNQELKYVETGTNYNEFPLINSLNEYENYAQNLVLLSSCTHVSDLRNIFDTNSDAIYWDQGHVSDKGNNIISKAIYNEISLLTPKILQSKNYENSEKNNIVLENNFLNILANYKTPIMFNSIFIMDSSFYAAPGSSDEISLQQNMPKSKKFTFETQSKIHDGEKIIINIEILIENDSKKILKIKTSDSNTESLIPNVTYFLKILNDDEIILSDFFYSEEDVLVLDISPNDSDSITILGDRQYDHNALIGSADPPILISGPVLQSDEDYQFMIGLRTLYEKSNWIFSLDDFYVEITS
ncbi:hypothetical protein A7X95_01720 [Candidatus Nitrosopelagicus brevis]|uniref:GDSL-like protein n=1 Tax=Candidatus Nitrosopelagicus brevis TaxID=1410606 RepID=A0A0A7V0T7_9ARCH|nr:SGNH/GDSL hydrolase family protein [Candidatus Nitrosopelagicus brevis]AJA92644.1 GDSL-like protein [Candidatus Nitrosopelagicus brevis]PTL88016.1 hypothetical protein A7X95_01720 [Candidatus Nitrosopelagicus brevis]